MDVKYGIECAKLRISEKCVVKPEHPNCKLWTGGKHNGRYPKSRNPFVTLLKDTQ